MSESAERPPRPPMLDDHDRPGPPPLISEDSRRSSRGLTVFIALFALAAFGAIVWYAYDQGRRTGSEESAPLIRADETPVRVKPENPGGMKVPHQDKLIFDKLSQGGSSTERPVEQLLPRPEEPKDVKPAPAAQPAPQDAAKNAEAGQSGQGTEVARVPPAQSQPKAPPKESGQTTDPSSGANTTTTQPRQLVPPAAAPKTAPPPPPPVTEQAAPKPAAPAKKAPAPKPAVKTVAKAPESVPPTKGGRFRVQIAAFKNEQAARDAWNRVRNANKKELGALALTIERINITGKGVFHRVQGGPLAENQARAICRTLQGRNQPCLVVRR